MIILVTCKNEEDLIKNEDARVLTTLNIDFFNHSRAAYSAVKGRIWLKFELIQDVMVILVTSKNEEDLIKNEGARMLTTLNIDFFNHSRAANSAVRSQIWTKIELIRDLMVVLITCKNEEDPIKNEAASVDNIFPIITLTRVLIRAASKPNAVNPPPQ